MVSSTFVALEQPHVEDRRAVVRGRNLVGAGCMGGQQAGPCRAVGRVPDQLFDREPAHALDEGAFDLADVHGRVERTAGVVQHVGAQQLPLAGERVHHHFADGGAVGEVVERPALHRFAVPAQAGGGVEAVGPQLHAVQVGLARRRRRTAACGRRLQPGRWRNAPPPRRRHGAPPRRRPAARGSAAPRPARPCRSGRCRSTRRWPRCWRPSACRSR